jgi:hypothetical protein
MLTPSLSTSGASRKALITDTSRVPPIPDASSARGDEQKNVRYNDGAVQAPAIASELRFISRRNALFVACSRACSVSVIS